MTPTYHLLLLLRRGCCKHGCCQRLLPLDMHSRFSRLEKKQRRAAIKGWSDVRVTWRAGMVLVPKHSGAFPPPEMLTQALALPVCIQMLASRKAGARHRSCTAIGSIAPVTPAAPKKSPHSTSHEQNHGAAWGQQSR